ncbi:hypothetical protein ColKHC_02059 [Colletotrichum higginsianum]|nr:hypothetical protein ColKHC_02059 [Colletotrichum higginsianum]
MSSKIFLALASILSLAASLPHTPRECSQTVTPVGLSTQPPQDNVPHLDLHSNITRQVVVFTGIPAAAKTCSLGWRQGPVETRIFRVDGSGLVSSRQLKAEGFPTWTKGSDVLINPTTIAPFQEGSEFSSGMDFTFWDQPDFSAPATHAGPSVKCEERIVVELAVNLNSGQDGRVFMQDDAENGLFISYS